MSDFEIEPQDVRLEVEAGCARVVDIVIEILPIDVHRAWEFAVQEYGEREFPFLKLEARSHLRKVAARRIQAVYESLSGHQQFQLRSVVLERRKTRLEAAQRLAYAVARNQGKLH
jgi:hypothetical protein